MGVDAKLTADAEVEEMKFKATHLIARQLPKEEATSRNAVLISPFFPWFPEKMFAVAMENGAYDQFCQNMGRLILERDQNLLGELIRPDLRILKKAPNITAREIRGFYFSKYGIQNRETIAVAGWQM